MKSFNAILLSYPSLVLSIALNLEATSVPLCDASIYGSPQVQDCKNLWDMVTSRQDQDTRFFYEQQLEDDDHYNWPGITNLFSLPIVQLPKTYSKSADPISPSLIHFMLPHAGGMLIRSVPPQKRAISH